MPPPPPPITFGLLLESTQMKLDPMLKNRNSSPSPLEDIILCRCSCIRNRSTKVELVLDRWFFGLLLLLILVLMLRAMEEDNCGVDRAPGVVTLFPNRLDKDPTLPVLLALLLKLDDSEYSLLVWLADRLDMPRSCDELIM